MQEVPSRPRQGEEMKNITTPFWITPVARNVLLEIRDDEENYSPLIVKPNSYRGVSGKMILVAKAKSCRNNILIGTEVLLDYPTDEVERNLHYVGGKKYFLVRENFIMACWEEEGASDA